MVMGDPVNDLTNLMLSSMGETSLPYNTWPSPSNQPFQLPYHRVLTAARAFPAASKQTCLSHLKRENICIIFL